MINIIAAVAKNGVIGSDGRIPWHIPEDMKYFRKTTTGGIIIMGRRSYEEIGRPLPERQNIIVSVSRTFCGKDLITARSLSHALELAEAFIRVNECSGEIFLCGGAKIYNEGLSVADRLYLTEIDREYDGDTFFPQFSRDEFRLISETRCDNAGLYFNVYDRIRNTDQVKSDI